MGNNPIQMVDPDGNWAVYDVVAAIVIGGTIGAIKGYKIGKAQGKTGWDLVGYTAAGFGIGAAVGVLSLYTGGAVAGAFAVGTSPILVGALAGAAGGAVSGLAGGIGFAALAGKDFSSGSTWKEIGHKVPRRNVIKVYEYSFLGLWLIT